MSSLLDARGCLTDAGLAALANAVPGQAPLELAQHVAVCMLCQDRSLKAGVPSDGRKRIKPEDTARRRWGMLAIVLGILLFALASLVATLSWLTH